jgi:phosphoserine phosphatase RsbU/P
MLFWTLAVTMPIYAGALYMSYQESARGLEAGAERDADELAVRLAAGLDAVIRPIEGGIRTVAGQLEEVDPPREQYPSRIRGVLAAWPDVYGSTIAVEVDDATAGAKPFAPYLFRRGDAIAYSDLAADQYKYRELPWYRRAADGKRPVWSLPYFDAGGGDTWMVTYSVPFYRKLEGARVLAGVVTADLDLNWMKRVAADVLPGPIGMGWLSAPPESRTFMTPIGPTESRVREFDESVKPEAMRDIAEQMLADRIPFVRLASGITAQPAYIAVRHLETLNWRLILVIPRHQLLAEARNLLNRQLLLGLGGLVLIVAAISIVAAGISRPLHALAESVGQSSEGDPDFQLPDVSRRDEIGVLAQALRRMRDSLRKHIELRAQTLADQARAEHELEIAASIQQSMLPRHDVRALPSSARVAAALVPARQVGGDLYDYYSAPDGNVLFAVGDVSDKGVPAALLMARLSALLRTLGASGDTPDRLLFGINARLAEGNDACMFVTLGCGQLNVHTGHLRYASAGHEPPLLRQPDGTVRVLAAENGPALGIDTGVDYRLTEGFMAPGDTLLLYTDGITEAVAKDGSLFGLERLSALLREGSTSEPAALIQRVLGAVNGDGFHTADDLTLLAINLSPPDVTVHQEAETTRWRIAPQSSSTSVRSVQRWARAILASRGVAADVLGNVELIVEELLSNIVRANEGRALEIWCDCVLERERIVLTSTDNGAPFDPLARASPQLDADITERAIGGLGIEIVRGLAEHCHYSYVDGRNVLAVYLSRSSEQ